VDDDWSQQFHSLLSSPLGDELIRQLNKLRQQQFEKAEDAKTDGESLRLLNRAGGVKLVIEHLMFLAVVPKDEGSKHN
jgi:hypothetical protein